MVSKVFFFFFFAVPALALLMTDVQKASKFSHLAYAVSNHWLNIVIAYHIPLVLGFLPV